MGTKKAGKKGINSLSIVCSQAIFFWKSVQPEKLKHLFVSRKLREIFKPPFTFLTALTSNKKTREDGGTDSHL